MTRTFLLRALTPNDVDSFWSSHSGWTPNREAAERFATRERAEEARGHLESDRVVVVELRGER
jgi:uncharacterized protein (DUF2235 family)